MKTPDMAKENNFLLREAAKTACDGYYTHLAAGGKGDPAEERWIEALTAGADAIAYVAVLESRLAQVERERDAAVNELPHNCWNCKYHRDTPIEEIDTGGITIHRYCDADYCYPDEENSSWLWRGLCPENSKEGECGDQRTF